MVMYVQVMLLMVVLGKSVVLLLEKVEKVLDEVEDGFE